jgi:hypothetical protein
MEEIKISREVELANLLLSALFSIGMVTLFVGSVQSCLKLSIYTSLFPSCAFLPSNKRIINANRFKDRTRQSEQLFDRLVIRHDGCHHFQLAIMALNPLFSEFDKQSLDDYPIDYLSNVFGNILAKPHSCYTRLGSTQK